VAPCSCVCSLSERLAELKAEFEPRASLRAGPGAAERWCSYAARRNPFQLCIITTSPAIALAFSFPGGEGCSAVGVGRGDERGSDGGCIGGEREGCLGGENQRLELGGLCSFKVNNLAFIFH